jgi:hypothetical protein
MIISDQADIAAAIAHVEQAGKGYLTPALRAAGVGLINLAFIARGNSVSPRAMKHRRRSIFIILGDDDYSSSGPAGWPQAEQLVRWARYIVLHGAGGEPEHYSGAVAAALIHHRLLMVETSSGQLEAWRSLVGRVHPRVPGLVITTPADAPTHPMEHAPAGAVLQ